MLLERLVHLAHKVHVLHLGGRERLHRVSRREPGLDFGKLVLVVDFDGLLLLLEPCEPGGLLAMGLEQVKQVLVLIELAARFEQLARLRRFGDGLSQPLGQVEYVLHRFLLFGWWIVPPQGVACGRMGQELPLFSVQRRGHR